MSVIAVAFFFGLLIWWDEHSRTAADHRPSICHACSCAGDRGHIHWAHGRWVHDDTGGDRTTRLDDDCALLTGRPAKPHRAVPTHHVDYGDN